MQPALVFALLVAAQAVAALEPRIVGGQEASPHQFPWQVGVSIYLDDGRVGFCGGSLIAKRWVLTAAHCASPDVPVTKFEVTLGAHYINDISESGRVTMLVNRNQKVVHDSWKGVLSGDVSGDIALLRLPQDAPLSDYIQIVRLPSEEQKKESFWRKTVTISGWGKIHNHDEEKAPVLRYTSNKVVSTFYCKLRFFFLLVKDTNICVSGWGGKGACHGDSGGPMVVYDDAGVPTLVGVTSFGFGLACDWGWPSAYTRVTSYLDWVNDAMKNAKA